MSDDIDYSNYSVPTPDGKGDGCSPLLLIPVVIIMLVLLRLGDSDNSTSAPEPTPVDTSAQVAAAVIAGLEPIISASARSVDAGTQASIVDTKAAHPEPERSATDVILMFIVMVCFPVFLILAVIVIVILRNKQIVSAIVSYLEQKKEQSDGNVVNPGTTALQAEPGGDTDINIG